ncbi:MAG: hypothetical protein WC632_03320 [Candidatus Margulisiibacteriota bacterium]
MAAIYKLVKHFTGARLYGANIFDIITYLKEGRYDYYYASEVYKKRVSAAANTIRSTLKTPDEEVMQHLKDTYLNPYWQDMEKVINKLQEEGYLDYVDKTGAFKRAIRRPKEHLIQYQEIIKLIHAGKYGKAVERYYAVLGDKYYDDLNSELIYLKRLANIPLEGRDILCFRTTSTQDELIESNLDEYVGCLNKVLNQYKKASSTLPLDIIIKNAPTMGILVRDKKEDWHKGVYLWDGEFKRDHTPVSDDTFSSAWDHCLSGRLFNKYPDQISYCKIIEYPDDEKYAGLWTTYSPSYIKNKVIDKGLHLNGIEAFKHKSWNRRDKTPDFMSVTSINEIEKSDYGTHNIRYTGRKHFIGGRYFYEIDLLRKNVDKGKYLGNAFLELVDDILREAENLLRENHNLPRIGEGWVSEVALFNLVKKKYKDAQLHGSPDWIKPQHLDIYIPSKNIAFEYQGRQHYEPVAFFGGINSFTRLKKLDRRKAKRCKSNNAVLIEWKYDDPINMDALEKKLFAI